MIIITGVFDDYHCVGLLMLGRIEFLYNTTPGVFEKEHLDSFNLQS